MDLKHLPIGDVQHDIPTPGVKKSLDGPVWARWFKQMKVGSCVRVNTKNEAYAMKAYFRQRNVPTTHRAVGDGTYVVWRKRAASKRTEQKQDVQFPCPSLFDE